jgi:hypothetical protein
MPTKAERAFDAADYKPLVWKARKDEAVLDALRVDGYTVEDNGEIEKDRGALRLRLCDLLIEHSYVKDVNGRNNDAITKEALAGLALPSVDFDSPDTDFDVAVQSELVSLVYNETATEENKPLQKLVNTHTKNGKALVMCRATPIQGKKVIYVTINPELIFADNIKGIQDSVDRAVKKLGKQLGLVAALHPELAERASKTLTDTVKGASASGKTAMGELVAGSGTEPE